MSIEIVGHSGNLSSNVDSDECMGIRLRNRVSAGKPREHGAAGLPSDRETDRPRESSPWAGLPSRDRFAGADDGVAMVSNESWQNGRLKPTGMKAVAERAGVAISSVSECCRGIPM